MAVIDYNTPVGKLRMRLGDVSDLPFLSDEIYASVYQECNQNLHKAVINCGSMILGQLSYRTRRKMVQLEVFGSDAFVQFRDFLLLTIKDPSFMDLSPIPYSATGEPNPLIQFQETWNRNFTQGTSEQLANSTASYSPNDGSKFGPFGG